MDYRVIFWTGASQASEYDLFEAEDVHAAIQWADTEARSRDCTYTLYAKLHNRDGVGLVWLAGINASAAGPTFDRSHPLG